MMIETDRLVLEPFTLELIDAAIARNDEAIASLHYATNGEWPEKDLAEALPFFRKLLERDGPNGFNSWIILLKSDRSIIGSAGFIGNPDERGRIEIGFGINKSKRRMGYCREAATALVAWAISQEGVAFIVARCDEQNEASIGAIRRLGFTETGRAEGLIEWIYRRPV